MSFFTEMLLHKLTDFVHSLFSVEKRPYEATVFIKMNIAYFRSFK